MPIVVGNTVIGDNTAETIDLVTGNYGNSVVNIDGRGGADTLTGNAQGNVINGGDGDDVINGGAGNDFLQGGAGNDSFILTGEWDNATYNQGNGRTSYYGGTVVPGSGNYYEGGTGTDTLKAGADELTMVLNEASELAADGIEAIDANGHTGFRVVVVSDAPQDFTAVKLEGVALDFGAGDDVITGSSADQGGNGASGNDTIRAGTGIDTVRFNGDLSGYSFEFLGGGSLRVTDTNSADGNTGIDLLSDVEQLQFNDQLVTLAPFNWQDTDATGGTAIHGVAGVLAENAANGTAVGIDVSVSLHALLPDQNVTFSLADTAGGRFAIDPVTGVITLANAALINYETAPILNGGPDRGFQVTVTATSNGFTSSRGFTILITDQNDAPGAPSDTDSAENLVEEGAANGTYAGITASASDLNGDSVTYSLSDDAGGRFAIDANTGIVTVANGTLLDFEAQSQWNVTIRASDGSLSSESVFTIRLSNGVSDVPADSDVSTADLIMEGAANGTYTGITAYVAPFGGGTVSYSLSDSAGGRFAIDPVTGRVTVANGALLDYETRFDWNITVRASDGGAYGEQVFTIYLQDFTAEIPTDSDVADDRVIEGAANGTYAGITAHAVSASGLPVTYSLVDNAGGRFAIDPVTGRVTVANGTLLDAESQTGWNILVRATDGQSTSDQMFVVYVDDVLTETWTGTGASETYTVVGGGTWVLSGAGGHDKITGGSGDDALIGGAGNDELNGLAGNDEFRFSGTGSGLDRVDGGDGYDIVRATADNTIIGLTTYANIEEISSGGFSSVTLQLGSNNDLFDMVGGITLTGIDIVLAGGGNDTIIAGDSGYNISGESGHDIIVAGAGADVLDGGTGTDTISYERSDSSVSVNLSTNTVSGGHAEGDVIANFENVTGSAHGDVITGNSLANTINGGAGDDVMDGGGGNDLFLVGPDSGTDAITGGAGTDTIRFIDAASVLALSVLSGIEVIDATDIASARITGTDANDTLNFSTTTLINIASIHGLGGDDVITGSTTADVISGGGGNDILSGGTGNDTFIYEGGDEGFDQISGGTGFDTVMAVSGGVTFGITSISSIEQITGFGDTIIQGSSGANTLNFSSTTLTGIAVIDGGAGNDTITGSVDSDTIRGGTGNDRLTGGAGDDTFLVGGTGHGIDTYSGGTGYDRILAEADGTTIFLASTISGIEEISNNGYAGVKLTGSSTNDIWDFSGMTLTGLVSISAEAGNDIVTGSAGNDSILGKSGMDALAGGGGDDRLTGGADADTLTGGSGRDLFDFDNISESGLGALADLITDFTAQQDRIDLGTIDANTALASNQAFTFLGTGAFTGTAGQLRYTTGAGDGLTHVYGDVNGDGTADFEIKLTGTLSLAASDFIL